MVRFVDEAEIDSRYLEKPYCDMPMRCGRLNLISRASTPLCKRTQWALAIKLIEGISGPFQPEKVRDEYAVALRELVRAKLEQRAPGISDAGKEWQDATGGQHHGGAERELCKSEVEQRSEKRCGSGPANHRKRNRGMRPRLVCGLVARRGAN